jgi:hypothetical protein
MFGRYLGRLISGYHGNVLREALFAVNEVCCCVNLYVLPRKLLQEALPRGGEIPAFNS